MTTFRNPGVSRCLRGGTVKNTYVFLGCLVAFGIAGCAPALGPQPATAVMLEDEVKVRVDSEGRPQVGANQAASAEPGKAP
jgi:hypothetical protein